MADRNRRSASSRFFLCAALLWAVLLLWLSLAPQPAVALPELLSWDKARHTAAYALLTLLLGFTFPSRFTGDRRPFTLGALAAFGFGALIEGLQGACTVTRQAEWGDLLANALGAMLVWSGACLLSRLFSRGERR